MRIALLKLFVALLFSCTVCIMSGACAKPSKVSVADGVVLDTGKNSKRQLVCRTVKNRIAIGLLKRIEGTNLFIVPLSSATEKFRRRAVSECKVRLHAPQCADGRDNDSDGLRDLSDPNCDSASDTSEVSDISPTPAVTATPDPDEFTGLQLLAKPFSDDYPLLNPFDHEFPRQFIHTNGYLLTVDEEILTIGIDGHQGHDFGLPSGTPLLAMGEGVVSFVGEVAPLNCPILGGTVSGGLGVAIRHTSNGRNFEVFYAHMSRIDVTIGSTVREGDVIGLSGNTGCSTTPHLHLEISEVTEQKTFRIDPFGWKGLSTDPWSTQSDGGASTRLWKAGKAPLIYREVRAAPNPIAGSRASIAITAVRWMGRRDDINPNNEFVEFQLDARYAQSSVFDLTGYQVSTIAGDTYTFPSGTTIRSGQTLRLYVGSGTGEPNSLAWGKTSGIMNNDGDCIQLLAPTYRMYYFFYEKGRCPEALGGAHAMSHAAAVHGELSSLKIPIQSDSL